MTGIAALGDGARLRPSVSSALEVGRRLAAGELDAVAVAEEALARARAAGCAFIALTEARARREAAASAARLRAGAPLGPLDGVPIAWKDLVDVAGVRTTAGSALRRDAPPATADAPVVARLAAAGLVCIGKTNLSELAYSGLGLNPHFGTPRNPRAPGRIPGGSSSGSAAAVAAGVVPCAIGTDTAGSIRVPAAFCGIVGFRPTPDRVDRAGVQPLGPSLDSVGPLTTTVADAIALDALLSRDDARRAGAGAEPAPLARAEPATLAGLHLVAPDDDLVDDVEPEVAAAFRAALAALTQAGAVVERRTIRAVADARSLFDRHGFLGAHEAWRVHRELLDGPDAERLDRHVLRRLRDGRALPPEGYDVLQRERPRLRAALAAELGDALAVWPSVRHPPPEPGLLERDEERFARVNLATLRATMPGSYLDMPGVTLPIAADGARVGLLLSGSRHADARVLAAALAVEAALAFVPADFDVPAGLATDSFRLVPLGVEHNEADYAAWSSSVDHIHATPGFADRAWPPRDGMPLEQNRAELEQHALDFAARSGFTYTVLAPDGDDVIGCVYIYPAVDGRHDAAVRSWVRARDAALDAPLHAAISRWLAERWPFERIVYAARSSRCESPNSCQR